MRTETFSYLPPMTDEQIGKQIAYILRNGWIPAIEFTDRPGPGNHFWTLWKLPLFEATTVEEVMAEVKACREAHPDCFIKIVGYDSQRQGQSLGFIVYRPAQARPIAA